jgi:hypothetical protein
MSCATAANVLDTRESERRSSFGRYSAILIRSSVAHFAIGTVAIVEVSIASWVVGISLG